LKLCVRDPLWTSQGYNGNDISDIARFLKAFLTYSDNSFVTNVSLLDIIHK